MAAYIPQDEQRRLIALVQQGDGEAFEKLLKGFDRMLWEIVRRVTRDEHLGEELHQVALIEFHRTIMVFDVDRGVYLSTYAYQCVHQKLLWYVRRLPGETCINQCRRGKTVSLSDDWDEHTPLAGLLCDGSPSHVDEFAEQEETDHKLGAVRAGLSQLDYRSRQVILRRFGGETLREVGGRFGLTKERIRQIETKALAKLRRIVKSLLGCGSSRIAA